MRAIAACLAVALTAALTAAAALAEEDCRLQIVASMPLHMEQDGHGSAIDASIDGKPVRLFVDTGSPSSVLSEEAAQRLGLTLRAVTPDIRAQFYGGARITRYARIENFMLGNGKAPRAFFMIAPAGRLDYEGFPIDGLIGVDFLSMFDVDFDFAGGKLNLFLPHRCSGRAVYWTDDESQIAKIPFTFDGGNLMVASTLDGKSLDAIVDTGMNYSRLDMRLAGRMFDLTSESPGMMPRAHAEGRAVAYTYPFKALSIGGVTVNAPNIAVTTYAHSKIDFEMILGMSVLTKLHLFIAFKERMLYVTPVGAHR